MKQRLFISLFLACAVGATAAPALLAQSKSVPNPLFTQKSSSLVDNDHVKLTLESFLSGNNVASDIAILVDMSSSMSGNISSGAGHDNYAKVRSLTSTSKRGGWTYNSLGHGNISGNDANQWYYNYNGEYYPVRRGNSLPDYQGKNNARAMWICLDPTRPEDRLYLSGTGLAPSYDNTITGNTQVIFSGRLYKGWTRNTAGNNIYYYKHTDNKYYPITQVTVNSTYQSSVSIDGTTYYLNGHSISETPNPYASNDGHISLFFGDLYKKQTQYRRVDYLMMAAEALLDKLAYDAVQDGLHHRVALIEFSHNQWSDETSTLESPSLEESPLNGGSTHLVCDFKDITNVSNLATLKEALATPISFQGESYYDYAFSLVRHLFLRELGATEGTDVNGDGTIQDFELPTLTGEDHNQYGNRPKIVVLIGDCARTNGSSADTQAAKLKSETEAIVFVEYVYQHTTHLDEAQRWCSTTSQGKKLYHHYDEFDADFSNELTALALEIRKPLLDLEADTVLQDGIADGFVMSVPASDIKVYTADYDGYDGSMEKEKLLFATPVLDESGTYPVTVSLVGGRQVVSVSGFNYYNNFCGTIGGKKMGKKLILEILISRTSAVGGPVTVTNTSDSGMKYSADGAFVTKFANPTLAFPVDIVIEKDGLAKGESAVFTVQPVDSGGDPVSTEKSIRVILTGNASGTTVSKTLKGLNKNCYWKITEEGWSWDYVPNEGNPSLSSVTQILNPFVFTNVKKGTTIKSAESKVSNDFGSETAATVNSRD